MRIDCPEIYDTIYGPDLSKPGYSPWSASGAAWFSGLGKIGRLFEEAIAAAFFDEPGIFTIPPIDCAFGSACFGAPYGGARSAFDP